MSDELVGVLLLYGRETGVLGRRAEAMARVGQRCPVAIVPNEGSELLSTQTNDSSPRLARTQ